MENEQILSVLTEILEEQKEDTKLLLGINTQLNILEVRMDRLEEMQNKPETGTIVVDTAVIQKQVSEEANQIKSMLAALHRNTTQEKRILLFPEHNAREYYSVVLRWMLYAIIATYGYWLIKYAISSFAH